MKKYRTLQRMLLGLFVWVLFAASLPAKDSPQCRPSLGQAHVQFTFAKGSAPKMPIKVTVTGISGFSEAPPVGAEVLVLPYPMGQPVTLKVVRSSPGRQLDAGVFGDPQIELEDATNTFLAFIPVPAGRNPDYPYDVALLWPAPLGGASLVKPSKDLPPGVDASTVLVSLNWHHSATVDGLISRFCCDNRHKASGCDYECTDIWQKVGKTWRRCHSSQPK